MEEEEGGGWSFTARDRASLNRLLRDEEDSEEMDATAK